jgi:HKD family nuclease
VLNILEQLDKQAGFSHAFLTTYDFAPGFFEDRILKTRALGSCPHIVILIDEGKYQEICHNPKGGRQINRRYMLLPVRMPRVRSGVFHPKVWLLLGKDRAELYVASCNLTRSGITSNLEMASTFAYAHGNRNKSSVPLFRSAYDFLQKVIAQCCSYSETVQQVTEQSRALSPVLSERADNELDVELVHSLDHPILKDFLKTQSLTAAKLTVLSPYFDSHIGQLLDLIAKKVPVTSVNIIVQQDTNTLDVEALRQWRDTSSTDLTVHVLSAPGRKLHAKIVLLESPNGEVCTALIGSANFTKAALLETLGSDGNVELCLALKGGMAQSVRESLQSRIFSKQVVSLEEVRSCQQGDEPPATDTEIKLYHAELDSEESLIKTVCHVDSRLAESIQGCSLLVKKIGSADPDTVCKIAHADVPKGIFHFSVGREDSAILSRSATVAIQAGTPDGELVSNYVWLLNVAEVHEALDRNYNAIARQFRESGKGLIEFINKYVEHGMIDKAIDLLARLIIRFENGGRGRVTRPPIRTPHAPIREDDGPELTWALTPGQRARFERGVKEFISKHHEQVLTRHIRRPNLNGLENFFDVMETCADLGITALKNSVMTASDVYSELLYGLERFAGDPLTEGYFRALWCKYYDVRDRLREALRRHKICERIIAYTLLLKTVDPKPSARKVGFIHLEDILDLTTTDHLRHCFDLVGLDEHICSRVADVLAESYENSEYCRISFDPTPRDPYRYS